jgi:hypothetical protein
VRQYNPPPNFAKEADPRFKGYVEGDPSDHPDAITAWAGVHSRRQPFANAAIAASRVAA